MTVTVLIRDSDRLYRFPDVRIAKEWLEEHPEEYGHDESNYYIYANQVPLDSIELATHLYIRSCWSCNRYISYQKAPDDNIMAICPNCNVPVPE